jgi:MFS family permease
MGFSAGVEVDVMGLIVRRWFGLRAAGRVFSMCFTAFIVGSAFGPLLMAAAFDRTHSYQLPLGGFVIGSLLVALAFAGISRYPQVAPRPPASVGEIAIGPNPPAELAAAPSAATP